MKKIKPITEQTPPLPKDKPATYGRGAKSTKLNGSSTGNRQNKQPAKSTKGTPQSERVKLEYDPDKKERDPGMTKR